MTGLLINGRFLLQRTTGVQRVAHELVAALGRRAVADAAAPRVTLLLPPGAEPPTIEGVASRVVPGPAHPHLWEQWALPRGVREMRGGLLLNLCGAAPAFGPPGQACLLHDAAVFDEPQAYGRAFGTWYRWLFRRQARRGARLLTVSAFSRARLATALGVPPERLAVVPAAAGHMARIEADDGAVARLGLADRPFLLAVGSANPSKRLEALVRAWQRRGRADARLAIVGGRDPRVFGDAARPAADGVVELGPVDDRVLKALYGAAAGLVFPSRYEGFGLPPLEAMACGCPVAVARAASLPEVCGDAALYLDRADDGTIDGAIDGAIDHAIDALLDDAALRAGLRARGLARAAAFSWDASAAALLAALGPGGAGARERTP